MKHVYLSIYLIMFFGLIACGSGKNVSVLVTWAANKEVAVNSIGGGYTVYSSQTSGFSVSDSGVDSVDVPFSSGVSAPLSTAITIESGKTAYIKVLAYGTYDGVKVYSSASTQISIEP